MPRQRLAITKALRERFSLRKIGVRSTELADGHE
jgi:hypothetical protein